MKEEDQDILFYAFRYALGRRSAAVSQVVGIINNRWGDIPRRNKEQMQAEIRHAVRMGRAGDKCDIKDWQKILNLKIKSGKDIDVPTRGMKTVTITFTDDEWHEIKHFWDTWADESFALHGDALGIFVGFCRIKNKATRALVGF